MVEIITLGDFNIRINGNNVSEYFRKTKKLIQLLSLLIVNRSKPIPAETICETIWTDSDRQDTNKALQNLVYRLRTIFADNGVSDFILFNNKTYRINDAHDITIDAYKIEDAYNAAIRASAEKHEKIDLLMQITELYNGDFIFNLINDDKQSFSAASRYKRMYVESVCLLSDIYLDEKDFDRIFQICDKAINLEPLEEPIYFRFIEAMRARGLTAQAIGLIENYQDVLYRETGANISEAMNSIYKTIKGAERNTAYDTGQVLNELMELNTLDNAMFCTFDVFKDIFRYEMRQTKRRCYLIVLILIEMYGAKDVILPAKTLTKAKKILNECCMLALRKGDVFASYSKSITSVMIAAQVEKDADGVIKRVRDMFYNRFKGERVFLKFERQATV